MLNTVRETGGGGAMVEDDAIIDAIRLLAETEGIFTEAAGGTTLAALKVLLERGVIPRNESIVVAITGNGHKTSDIIRDRVEAPIQVGRSFDELDAVLKSHLTSVPV